MILAILLAVNGALASATAQLGWLMSFGLQSLFFWAVFLQRKTLADSLIGIATGPKRPGAGGLVAGARDLRGRSNGRPDRCARCGAGEARRSGTRGPSVRSRGTGARARAAPAPKRAPLFGTHYSAPVGGGAPPLDAPGPAAERPRPAPAAGGTEKGRPATPAPSSRKARRRPPRIRQRHEQAQTAEAGRAVAEAPRASRVLRRRSPAVPPEREGKQPSGRAPVPRPASSGEAEPSLAEELRAEREQGREAQRKPPAEKKDRPDPAASPRRPGAGAGDGKAAGDERPATSWRIARGLIATGALAMVVVAHHRDGDGDPRLGDRLHGRGRLGARRPGDPCGRARDSSRARLRIYQAAGRRIDIDWSFLAAIGYQECGEGNCAGVNSSGCAGPMQIGYVRGSACSPGSGPTIWELYRVDGDGGGVTDVNNPADAILTAARILRKEKGAPPAGGSYAAYREVACGYYGACSDGSPTTPTR